MRCRDMPEQVLRGVELAAPEAACLVHRPLDDEPGAIVAGIDRFAEGWRRGRRPLPDGVREEEAPFFLGALCGIQFVRAFAWEWRVVTIDATPPSDEVAVVSADRALAIYPLHIMVACFHYDDIECAVLRAFDWVQAGKGDAHHPGDYANVVHCLPAPGGS